MQTELHRPEGVRSEDLLLGSITQPCPLCGDAEGLTIVVEMIKRRTALVRCRACGEAVRPFAAE
jgi:hypothetical protein